MNVPSRILIAIVKFYQKNLSRRKIPCCRYYPTCSCYAAEAISVHGAFKGSLLAARRVLRCNPLIKGGYDPVPPRKQTKK